MGTGRQHHRMGIGSVSQGSRSRGAPWAGQVHGGCGLGVSRVPLGCAQGTRLWEYLAREGHFCCFRRFGHPGPSLLLAEHPPPVPGNQSTRPGRLCTGSVWGSGLGAWRVGTGTVSLSHRWSCPALSIPIVASVWTVGARAGSWHPGAACCIELAWGTVRQP